MSSESASKIQTRIGPTPRRLPDGPPINTYNSPCAFCEIIAGRAPVEWATPRYRWPDTVAFTPLNPVVSGHVLVVPVIHVPDFTFDPDVSADTMRRASQLGQEMGRALAMNLITSKGREATQSVFHLHLHLVPRTALDTLTLPWDAGKDRK
ncbi:HIT domain-containing protein [Streptomyces sp. NPDC000927]|uniref:HIT family protein n=1 Tax=Streptomyces sp. NPDC000927 TaxID=3154371 RepID=UPI003324E65B